MIPECTENGYQKQRIACYREALHRGEQLPFSIVSNSMSPLLSTGGADNVLVRYSPFDSLRPGDMIAFASLIDDVETLCIHRIILKVKKDGTPLILTKGDANIMYDALVHEKQILGKVVSWRTGARWFTSAHLTSRVINVIFLILSISAVYPLWYALCRRVSRRLKWRCV